MIIAMIRGDFMNEHDDDEEKERGEWEGECALELALRFEFDIASIIARPLQ